MSFDEAVEVLQDRMVEDPWGVPEELHRYLQGAADNLPPRWSTEDLIKEADDKETTTP